MEGVKDSEFMHTSDFRLSGRTAIIMPVYNEADTIESTIRELNEKVGNRLDFIDIWVFEDGSRDGTKNILSKPL